MNKPLKIYKASAGSGKTFTLAVEYIKLLIIDPTSYRNILAVTFTNKATGEMKQRILSQLYGISRSLSDSDDYFQKIKETEEVKQLELSDRDIRSRAGLALSMMTHDYNRFRIETIDSFFQSIVREVARELDLTANLRVDLNQKEVLADAVKSIIEELDEKSQVFANIMDYINEKISEDSNWIVESEINEFGLNIFNEQYLKNEKDVRKHISDSVFLRRYKSMLYAKKENAINAIKKAGQDALDWCERHGLSVTDIKYGDKSPYTTVFCNMVNGKEVKVSNRVIEFANEPKAWFKKGDEKNLTHGSELCNILQNCLDTYHQSIRIANTVKLISSHINQMMLLNEIDTKVRDLNKDANRFLLADTAHFLRELIDESDIPFIYERTGTKLKHIMIDEFQDTSLLQWDNFRPLLNNSIAGNDSCLIVGDVKQSIYRWRNSDWGILNNIENSEYSNDADVETLGTNFRSAERVVKFNNMFFPIAAQYIDNIYDKISGEHSQDIHNAYLSKNAVEQTVSKKNIGVGYVNISNITIGKKKKSSKAEQEEDTDAQEMMTYEEATLNEIVREVRELTDAGVRYNDIAILVRHNKSIPKIAEYLIDNIPDINIITDDAFRLKASSALTVIMQAFKVIANYNDRFAASLLAYYYQTLFHGNDKEQIDSYFIASNEELADMLPKGFAESIDDMKVMPLYELAEKLYSTFSLHILKGQDAYLFSFYDHITNYLQTHQSSIDDFISYWDDVICDKSIPANSGDGIRIMTIHKSKGLEFHSVIVPFCDWDAKGKSTTIWCHPDKPFEELPLAPIEYSNATRESIFDKDYNNELLKNLVDNLNLIYVAFTRAGQNLYIIDTVSAEPDDKKKEEDTSITMDKIINNTVSIMTGNNEEPMIFLSEDDEQYFIHKVSCGDISPSCTKEQKDTDNVLCQKEKEENVTFVYHKAQAEFRQSNASIKYVMEDANDKDSDDKHDFIAEGLLFHRLFELLSNPDDVDKAIRQLECEGCFSNTLEKESARHLILRAFEQTIAREWFDPKWKAYNECSILVNDSDGVPIERRPDRVITDGAETIVIDYKTGRQHESHITQVQSYISLLQQMGFPNVHGYVWYIRRGDIIEVK